ncbi:hypothetical protein [Sorangium sp. So ce1099]|uniref:hypothetical protein n=1 Tax=Sorangium sp. So ce1099 TaxID=3133331 RepID=UPI003F62AE48
MTIAGVAPTLRGAMGIVPATAPCGEAMAIVSSTVAGSIKKRWWIRVRSERNFRYACAPETVYDFVWNRAVKLSFERASSCVHVRPSFEPRSRHWRGSRSG